MAYDFIVRESNNARSSGDVIGCVEYHDAPIFARLMKRVGSSFLNRISDIYADQAFSVEEVKQALGQLLPLMLLDLPSDERAFLHKLIAVLSYSDWRQEGLYGVGD